MLDFLRNGRVFGSSFEDAVRIQFKDLMAMCSELQFQSVKEQKKIKDGKIR